MKKLSIYPLLFLITACSNCQTTHARHDEFYFNSDKIALILDTATSTNNYFVSKFSDSSKARVKFDNIPSNIVIKEDEFGDEFTYIDSTSIYEINYIDTIQSIDNLSIKYIIDGKGVDTISFRYEILSERSRISSKGLNQVLASNLTELLKKDLVQGKNVAILMYGFLFYQGENLYSLGGTLCVVLKNE